jgi:glycosyltransferase involved in cell wall biosynthesis
VRVLRFPSSLFYRGGAPDALGSGRTAFLEALRFSGTLGRALRARHSGYDALLSHWLVPCGALTAALVGGRPHVAIAHSSDIHLLRRLRLESLARYVAARSRLVYTSASLRIPGALGVVVPMGIDVAAFRATAEQRALAQERWAVDSKTVLFLGRLVPVKGVSVLLQALAKLPSYKLWIAGEGPLAGALQAEAAALGTRVRFLGEVDAARRRELLWACDVLAVPSLTLPDGRTEGAPQVVLEGLAAGCAVVASAVGGIGELLGDAGWLLPPGNAEALATALREAGDDQGPEPAPRAKMRTRALLRAHRFDWSVVAPQILGALTAPQDG